MKTKPGQGEKFTKMEDSSPVSLSCYYTPGKCHIISEVEIHLLVVTMSICLYISSTHNHY